METFFEKILPTVDIEQGDIFENLPFLNLTNTSINEVIAEGETIKYKEIDLREYVSGNEKKNIVVTADIKPGIMITQNCDLVRSEFVSFCAIRPYSEVEKNFSPTNPNKQVKFLTEEYAHKVKYFYLPSGMPNGFSERMAVDFSLIHQVKTSLLKELISKRKCRLNPVASEHFRVKLAHYFRRFAYNPWYVLNKDEFDTYKGGFTNPNELALISPYDWNK